MRRGLRQAVGLGEVAAMVDVPAGVALPRWQGRAAVGMGLANPLFQDTLNRSGKVGIASAGSPHYKSYSIVT